MEKTVIENDGNKWYMKVIFHPSNFSKTVFGLSICLKWKKIVIYPIITNKQRSAGLVMEMSRIQHVQGSAGVQPPSREHRFSSETSQS